MKLQSYNKQINNNLSCIENINESLSKHYLIYKIVNMLNGKYYIGQHQTNLVFDGYLGSGKLIHAAEEKYGLNNFTKVILFDYDNFEDMNNKEIELVQLSNCFPYDPMSYNLTPGGYNNCILYGEQNGMFGKNPFENKSKEELDEIWNKRTETNKNKPTEVLIQESINRSNAAKKCWENEEYRQNVINGILKSMTPDRILSMSEAMTGENNPMFGKSSWDFMSEDDKKKRYEKIKENNKGERNPAFGRTWMYHPQLNKRKYAKPEEVDILLDLGYVIGQNFKANIGKKRMYLPGTNIYGKMINENEVQKYIDLGYKFGVNPDISKKVNKGSSGKFWIYNPTTLEKRLLNIGQKIPTGWAIGYKRTKPQNKSQITIYNINTGEIRKISRNESIPNGWKKRPYNNGIPRKNKSQNKFLHNN